MQKLAEICVRRPVFTWVLILSLVVVGLFAYDRLGVDRFPKIDFPFVTISTRLVGAAPEEIETEVTDKIEEAVNTISGIDQLISISAEGVSQVIVKFDLEKNPDVAAQEVRDRVNSVLRDLPRDADPPVIEKIDPDAAPVLSVAVSAAAPIRDVTEFADKVLRRQIESVLGVGQVKLIGGRRRQINVVVDPAKLAGLGLTAAEVAGALASQNVQLPGRPRRAGPARPDPAHLRPRRHPRGLRRHRDREPQRHPGARLRRGPGRGRRRGGGDARERQRRARGRPPGPQAVGHEHDRGRASGSRTAWRA